MSLPLGQWTSFPHVTSLTLRHLRYVTLRYVRCPACFIHPVEAREMEAVEVGNETSRILT
jgi:hypothetical protein